jgi:transcriptional regulator with XRE-family HTH domain
VSLGARLRNLRLRKGQSLQQVAEAVGASKAHIWELETGKSRNPSIELLTRLADHYGVSVSILIGENPGTVDEDQLIRMFRQLQTLEDGQRDIVDDMIQSMLKRRKAARDGARD